MSNHYRIGFAAGVLRALAGQYGEVADAAITHALRLLDAVVFERSEAEPPPTDPTSVPSGVYTGGSIPPESIYADAGAVGLGGIDDGEDDGGFVVLRHPAAGTAAATNDTGIPQW